MTAMAIELARETAANWRTTADDSNPAGPLYSGGAFAEADIVAQEWIVTMHGCSACTASHTTDCC
jgi:Family of unknown function (DUF6229)